MTRIAPPPMKAMSPRRAYLLVVGGDPSRFVGSEMLSPPTLCIPQKANIQRSNAIYSVRVTMLQIEMPHGGPVVSNHMTNRFSRLIPCCRHNPHLIQALLPTASNIDISYRYMVKITLLTAGTSDIEQGA